MRSKDKNKIFERIKTFEFEILYIIFCTCSSEIQGRVGFDSSYQIVGVKVK